jgi:hypothetical protein
VATIWPGAASQTRILRLQHVVKAHVLICLLAAYLVWHLGGA